MEQEKAITQTIIIDNDLQLVIDAIKDGIAKMKEFNERIDKQYPNSKKIANNGIY